MENLVENPQLLAYPPTLPTDHIRQAVEESGLSAQVFAELAGLPKQRIFGWKNHGRASLHTVLTVAITYDLSVDWLLGLKDQGDWNENIRRAETEAHRRGRDDQHPGFERSGREAAGMANA